MPKPDFVQINVGFNRFVGNPDSRKISNYIGDGNFAAIRDPALKYRPIYIFRDASIVIIAILFPLFTLLALSSHVVTSATLAIVMIVLCLFIAWVRSKPRGPNDGELKDNSSSEYSYQLADLINFKEHIKSGKVTMHIRRTAISSGNTFSTALSPSRVSDDHGLLWIFGKERGQAWPDTILIPLFEGELFVDASAVSSHLPKMIEEVLRQAALAPTSVPKMPPIELNRLEQAMKRAGTWSDQIDAVMKLLHAYRALPAGLNIETATDLLLRAKATPLQREGTRKVLGGRYKPLLNVIRKTAQAFEFPGVPNDTKEDPDNQSP